MACKTYKSVVHAKFHKIQTSFCFLFVLFGGISKEKVYCFLYLEELDRRVHFFSIDGHDGVLRLADGELLEFLFKVRCLDDGFPGIVDFVFVQDGFDSELSGVRKAGGEVRRRNYESRWVASLVVRVLVVLDEELHGWDAAIVDCRLDVVVFFRA